MTERAGAFTLVRSGRSSKPVAEAEITDNTFEVDWVCGVSLLQFLYALDGAWDEFGGASPLSARVFVAGNNVEPIYIVKASRPSQIVESLSEVGPMRVVLLRVMSSNVNAWYDTAPNLSQSRLAIKIKESRVALTFGRGTVPTTPIAAFYNKTSKIWLFPSAIEEAFAELLRAHASLGSRLSDNIDEPQKHRKATRKA